MSYNKSACFTGIKTLFYAIFFYACIQTSLQAQRRIRFENIDMEVGLANNQVRAITKDLRGFIWIATGNGLQRYDGHDFKNFQYTGQEGDPIQSNTVRALLADRLGRLWIGTRGGGLSCMENGVFTTWRKGDGSDLPSDDIESLSQSIDGSIWIGTKDSGLVRWKDGVFTSYVHDPNDHTSLSHNSVFALTTDHRGRLWIGTFGGGVDLMENGSFKHFNPRQPKERQLDASRVTALLSDYEGNIWVGTWKEGLHNISRSQEVYNNIIDTKSLANSSVLSLAEDREGSIWIGTWGAGLIRRGLTGQLTSFQNRPYEEKSLTNNYIECIFPGSFGVVWVGTYLGGISKVIKGEFQVLKATGDNGLLHEYITGIYQSAESTAEVWFGTYEGGVYLDDDGEIEHYPVPYVGGNSVWGIAPNKQGALWIGTEAGLLKLDDGKYQKVSLPDQEQEGTNAVYDLTRDENGDIWFGDWAGSIYRIDYQSNEVIKEVTAEELEGKTTVHPVFTVLKDTKGRIWASRYDGGGLALVQKGRPVKLFQANSEEGVSFGDVNSIIEDHDGQIWIGTTNGLVTYDEEAGKIKKDTILVELDKQYISSIELGRHNELWLSTLKGLYKLNTKNHATMRYRTSDGLPGEAFIRGASFRAKDGKLYFGGGDGLSSIYPESLVDHQNPPMAFTSLSIQSEPVNIMAKFGKPLTQLDEIELDHWENTFSIGFASLDYSRNSHSYQYYLKGLEEGFKDVGDRRYANYNSIPPGSYTLYVRNAEEGSREISIKVNIAAPIVERVWFKALVGCLLVLLIFALYKLRVRGLKRKKERLEEAVAKRTEQIQAQNEELASQAEELATSNSELQSTMEELRQSTEELTTTNQSLNSVQKNLKNALLKEKQSIQELKNTQDQLIQSEKMASVGLLTAGIAHEVKNPINFISAGSSALALQLKEIQAAVTEYQKFESATEEELKELQAGIKQWKIDNNFDEEVVTDAIELTDDICMGSDRVTEIVNSLRSFSRTDTTQLQEASLCENIDSTLIILKAKYKDRIEIAKMYDPNLPSIICYPGKLSQVFMNLIANAIQAIEGKGMITIQTQKIDDNQVCIKITDTGKGMPASVRDHIFDPFFTTKGVGEGTGLGLHISSNIIEQHHGTIQVDSEEGKGTSFTIILPVKQDLIQEA